MSIGSFNIIQLCIIFNIHTPHNKAGIAKTREVMQCLIDLAIQQQGSFFLTYHRYASAEQVLACYPNFEHWLALKKQYDPGERFQSDWYRHYKSLFEKYRQDQEGEPCAF